MATSRLSSKMLKARTQARRRATSARATPGNGGTKPETYATGSNAPTTGELQLEISIGRRVRLLRQRLQLTATELAAQAGLSPGMLSKIENGGTSPSLSTLKALARAAEDLQTRGYTDHHELLAFSSWGQVQDYVSREESGSDLKVLVDLIDRHGADVIISTVDRLVKEDRAEVTISTAHKSKGREWSSVRIATDFREPKDDPDMGEPGDIPREDAMLAYVAVTRAQHVLDREGLEWVDRWVSGSPRAIRDAIRSAAPAQVPVWEPAPVAVKPVAPEAAAICWRCGKGDCPCDPDEAAAYSARLLIPAGDEEARAAFLASHDHLGNGQWRPRVPAGASA